MQRRTDTQRRFDLELTPKCVEPIFHVGEPGAPLNGAYVEPTAVVDDLDTHLTGVLAHAHRDR